MKIVDLSKLKGIPVALTLGSFDGLHKGHIELLNRLKHTSSSTGCRSLLMTFHPHPRKVVDTDFNMKLLNTREEKIEILSDISPDFLHFINFTTDFSKMSYTDFYDKYILENINLKSIIAGSNHVFGRGREGTGTFLSEFCKKNSIDLFLVGPVNYQDKNISSTRIRKSITEGDIEDANNMLGYSYSFKGPVIKGSGTGSKIGFPTANISLKDTEKIVPANGVYLVSVNVSGKDFYGLSNIGTKPTFGDFEPAIETHIFGFSENIYGKDIRILFKKRLRQEMKFNSAQDLISAIESDMISARRMIQDMEKIN